MSAHDQTVEGVAIPATPIAPGERIEVLDAIRGFALLGIFIMNMPGFSESLFLGVGPDPAWPQWWNRGTEVVRDVMFSGKFNSMFSMLFAVGFTIQLDRLRAREPQQAVGIYLRRLFWLFVFGAVHTCVFWAGDVLHMYALLGVLLLIVQRMSDRAIVAMFVACLLFPAAVGIVRIVTVTPEDIRTTMLITQQAVTADDAAFGHGTFFDTVRRTTADTLLMYKHPLRMGLIAAYVQFLTTMLFGLLLGRHRFFHDIAAHLPLIRRAQWWSLLVGLLCGVGFMTWRRLADDPMQPDLSRALAATGYVICRVAIMIFYVATIVRAVCNERWRRRIAPVTLAGRMPLTNYLMQTLIGVVLFYHWGFGWWGRIGPAAETALAIAIFFIVQVPLTRWWLARFDQGPMEYLWRVLTYGRAALAKAQPVAAPNAYPGDRPRASSPDR